MGLGQPSINGGRLPVCTEIYALPIITLPNYYSEIYALPAHIIL